ncbi:MAG: response regulator [Acaryochloridaceae cyanobacterium RL_2_7]|nr:response regulator [Acaryochloridaceae cyanobacterium RL_2_7]
MDSEIQVQSNLDQGATFSFDLPLQLVGESQPPRTAQIDQAPIMGYHGSVKVILYVDDHRDNSDVFTQLMTPLGFNVITASNGQEALTILSSMTPDLIVTDLIMPKMDGYELLEYLRRHDALSGIPVIVASASVALREKREKFIPRGEEIFNQAD